jgi:hypothetical protein
MSSGQNDASDRRYGHRSGTGANAPRDGEKKEQREEWVHRQGGDQTRDEHGRRLGDVRNERDQDR